jgi:hypothetical protein
MAYGLALLRRKADIPQMHRPDPESDMKRRTFLSGLLATSALSVSASAAFALTFAEDVVAQLVKLGFSDITAETTLLGRVRIRASRSDGTREIIINPRTGEILRDIWMATGDGGTPRTVLNDIDDSDDDDSGSGKDDDNSAGGDDDNSGSGGGDDDNSGHGNGDDDGRDDDRDDRGDDDDGRDDREDKKDD